MRNDLAIANMMDINLEAGQIVEITTAPSTPPKKISVPILGLEKFPTQQEIEGQDVRNRRPVRPIDRQRMRPWLMELLDVGNVFGLRWTNRHQGIFQISWRHASRLGWNLETDGDVFERWARHTGIYKEGDPPEPKRWKANFRCALHSLHDVMELTHAVERRGRNACRTYQFLQNNNSANPKSRSKEKRQKAIEPKETRELVRVLTYDRPIRQPVQIQLQESGSSDELISETESDGSHQDKVIVQRLDAKSGEIAEEFLLHHDHDYSGHQEKTQRTIYLRQGVGSIVLHKEVLNVPRVMEDAKAAEALSNLEQLASAAVGSQDVADGTIMIDANAMSEGSNKGSPAKSSSLKEDNRELSLKTLLPRLRARIKESERAGGLIRKRKLLEIDTDGDGDDKKILGHTHYKLKKKSDPGVSPPSPPMTRRRSNSPKKQTKQVAKTKRSRKESEGSASDSTEPLMSSCLLLLEAATRLDNAEKGEGMSEKVVSKRIGKVVDKMPDTPLGKRRRGLRSEKVNEEMGGNVDQQDMIEETVIDQAMIESVIGQGVEVRADEETVIEEKIIYPEDTVQIVYEETVDENGHQAIKAEVQGEGEEQTVYADILRTALENIGSELEVTTSSPWEISSPKEMAIMRRKKDIEKTSVYNALTLSGGKIVVTEASFAKGLFSGSEIVPNISQTASNVRKAAKVKSKGAVNKDNVYYVDVSSHGGSICVRQSDGAVISNKDPSFSQITLGNSPAVSGVQQTVLQKELPILNSSVPKLVTQGSTASSVLQGISSAVSSPQIFIAAGQNSSGQPIVVPINNQKVMTTINPSSVQQADLNNLKQTIGNLNKSKKSFISLGPQGKPIILKSKEAAPSSIPVLNQIGSPVLSPNVKISTLPIISTLKPIVSISAPVTSMQRKPSSPTTTTSSVYPVHLVPNVSTSQVTAMSGQAQQTVTLVPTQIGSQGGKTFFLQQQVPANPDQNKNKSKSVKIQMMTTGSTLSPTVSLPQTQATVQTQVINSPALSTSMTAASATKKEKDNVASRTIHAQVIMDPVKGPYLKLPMTSAFPLSQNLVLSSTPSSTATQGFTQEVAIDKTDETQYLKQDSQSSADTNVQLSDFGHIEIFSTTQTNQTLDENLLSVKSKPSDEGQEVDVKTEPDGGENSSSVSVVQNEGEEGLVFTVKQEDVASSSSYFVQLPDQDPQVRSSSSVPVRVEVQSEMGDQTCFISPEQLEEANHIIHISQEMEAMSSSKTDAAPVETVVEMRKEDEQTLDKEIVKSEPETEFSDTVTDAGSHGINIDPMAPLAITEIPLFASSKGDRESTEDDHNE